MNELNWKDKALLYFFYLVLAVNGGVIVWGILHVIGRMFK